MKLLVIQTAFIGDVVLATAVVEQLRRFYPDAEIDFLLRKGNEKLLSGHPQLREILVWDKKTGKYRELWRLLRHIRRTRYDMVVNCQRFAASGFLTAFSGAKQTVGFDKNPFSFLFTRRVAHRIGTAAEPMHEVRRNLALLGHLGDGDVVRPRLYPAPADFEKAARLAAGRRYVCVAPTSVWFTKQYPAHKWAELLKRLPPDCRVFLLGGPADADACRRMIELSARQDVINAAGQLSFLESAALMQDAAMNYVNDSAPLHFASAVNAPVAAVFCSTLPAFGFTPLSDRSAVVQAKTALPCRPCGLHGHKKCPEGHFRCAEDIDVEDFPVPENKSQPL
jgi:ADP-heptose:LPS heptosyltransferase